MLFIVKTWNFSNYMIEVTQNIIIVHFKLTLYICLWVANYRFNNNTITEIKYMIQNYSIGLD